MPCDHSKQTLATCMHLHWHGGCKMCWPAQPRSTNVDIYSLFAKSSLHLATVCLVHVSQPSPSFSTNGAQKGA
eukprot:1368417-Amphidinium_carterae.1